MKYILIVFLTLFITACDTVETIEVSNYNGQPIRIGDNVFVKKLHIQGMKTLVYCDENGKILPYTPINLDYPVGKFHEQSVVLPTKSNTESNKFQFNCSNIEDCYKEILIVKNSIR